MNNLVECDTDEKLYTIGEAANIGNISRKTLRFYEELGLLIPDLISTANGYRYYKKSTILMIPIIKYYKQMGFKLSEMEKVSNHPSTYYHENKFITKLNELKEEEQQIRNRYTAVSDWFAMIQESNLVLENDTHNVNLKFIGHEKYIAMDQQFCYDYRESIINVSWIKHMEENHSEITGPVILKFSSYKEKMAGTICQATIMQKPITKINGNIDTVEVGDSMCLCTYHVGDHLSINSAYEDIENWAAAHHYRCGPQSYERYLMDYWATNEKDNFVTEVMIPAIKEV